MNTKRFPVPNPAEQATAAKDKIEALDGMIERFEFMASALHGHPSMEPLLEEVGKMKLQRAALLRAASLELN